MDNIKLNYLHVCDLAFLSDKKKANIIGIFKAIYSSSFPFVYPKFVLVASFLCDPKTAKGDHRLRIKLIRKSDQKELKDKPLDLDFQIQDGQSEINFIIDIINTTFEKPEAYTLVTYIDDREVGRNELEVIKT